MAWRLLDRPKTQRVTKALAQNFVDMEPAPHDRPLSERRLAVYQRMLALGQFRPVTWASALCVETSGVYRVNGKHTSIMLSGLDVMPDFFVTIEEYECDTLEDVAKLYSTFDSNMQSRTARDIYYSFAATVPELRGVNAKVIQAAATGMAYHLMGPDVYDKSQAADRAEYLIGHSDFVLWANSLVCGSQGKIEGVLNTNQKSPHLLRQPVFAAMIGCWLKKQEAATEFWSQVRDDSGKTPDCPDRKLSRYLLTMGMRGGSARRERKHNTGRAFATTREVYVKCIHAWNAWRKGEGTALNYYADRDVPTIK